LVVLSACRTAIGGVKRVIVCDTLKMNFFVPIQSEALRQVQINMIRGNARIENGQLVGRDIIFRGQQTCGKTVTDFPISSTGQDSIYPDQELGIRTRRITEKLLIVRNSRGVNERGQSSKGSQRGQDIDAETK
jgi:hypothetical protein